MAALHEGFTLCKLVSGLQGVEPGREADHVLVTDRRQRSVTVYKVSDQKPLGCWTVKQGQTVTCPAVWLANSGEYGLVTDGKVIRIWKDEDTNLEKAFKATVCADVERLLVAPGVEPVVLFACGALRLLDSLLANPQQSIEKVLQDEEIIRWSTVVVEREKQVVLFTTEQKNGNFLYVQHINPNTLQKCRLETVTDGHPLSVCAAITNQTITLLYLCSNGGVYQSVLTLRGGAVGEGVQTLPKSMVLKLPVEGNSTLSSAATLLLDDANVAVVGVPHPTVGTGKDFLCIWNIHFQTVQAEKELTGGVYGQLWCCGGKLYVPHGKALEVIPYECEKSSLAAALGRHKQFQPEGSAAPVTSWSNLLYKEETETQRSNRGVATRKSKQSRKSQAASAVTVVQVQELMKTGTGAEAADAAVEALLSGTPGSDLQVVVGQVASQLVSHCLSDPSFYSSSALLQLVQTQCLCHSVCPELVMLALEKEDYTLTQLCLQLFPDVPEAVTCACLKAFLDVQDSDLEATSLELNSMLFVEGLVASCQKNGTQENGFSSLLLEDSCDSQIATSKADIKAGFLEVDVHCPVGMKKAVLLNEILQTAYTETFLLPHLKDLSVQQVILFLQYLRFLYQKYSDDTNAPAPGLRSPTEMQIIDWISLILDAHFTVIVMVPEARGLLSHFYAFVKWQVQLFSEMGKLQSSLQELNKIKASEDVGLYSIEIIELF